MTCAYGLELLGGAVNIVRRLTTLQHGGAELLTRSGRCGWVCRNKAGEGSRVPRR